MRFFPRALRTWTALILVLYWGGLDIAPAAAGLAPSRLSGATEIASTRDADVQVIERALEHKLVVQKLRDYGISPADVRTRMERMSDAEIHELATASRGLPSGGDGFGALIAILVIVILVIVIVKLMNKEIVIK
jgi:hypothetical protein